MALTTYIEQEILKFFLGRTAAIPSAYYLGLGLYDTSNPAAYAAWAEDGSTSGTEPTATGYARAPLTWSYDGGAERAQSLFKTQDPISFAVQSHRWIAAGSSLCFGYAAVFDAATGGNVIAALNLPRPPPGTPYPDSLGKRVVLNGGVEIILKNGDYAAGSGDAAYFGLDAGIRAALGKRFFLGTTYPYTRAYTLGVVGQPFLGPLPAAQAMSGVLAACEYTAPGYARQSLADADFSTVGWSAAALCAYATLQTQQVFGPFSGGGSRAHNNLVLIDTDGNCVALAAPEGNLLVNGGPANTSSMTFNAGDTLAVPANRLYLYFG